MISVTVMVCLLETHPKGKHIFFPAVLYCSAFILFIFLLLVKLLAPDEVLSQGPGQDARIVYIDGAFDLFHAGHVEVIWIFALAYSFSLFLS